MHSEMINYESLLIIILFDLIRNHNLSRYPTVACNDFSINLSVVSLFRI